jgi:tRNA(Ile)-lysidine synthase TilS/MesJ
VTTLYSDEIRAFIRTRPWPTGLQWEIVEYEDYLGFRFFRDNFNSFDGEERYHIAMLVKEVMEKIRKDGIPIYMEKMESAYWRDTNG